MTTYAHVLEHVPEKIIVLMLLEGSPLPWTKLLDTNMIYLFEKQDKADVRAEH